MTLIPLTNQTFLEHVAKACPAESFLWTCFGAGDPYADSFNWSGNKRRPDGGVLPNNCDLKPVPDLNTFYSVAAVKPNEAGEVKRQKLFFDRMLVLVVDDVKVETLQGSVSYILETSPGNPQAGILLRAEDPDCEDIDLCTALVTKMNEVGLISGDKNGNAVTRYVRLPVGANHKPKYGTPAPRHELKHWAPEIRMTLAEAAAVVGMDLEDVRATLKKVREMSERERVSKRRAAVQLGETASQGEKVEAYTKKILAGVELHDSINGLAASMVASGAAGGSVMNFIRGLMHNSAAKADPHRWKSRFDDIDRAVASAEQKFKRERIEAAAGGRFQVSGDVVINTASAKRALLTKAGALVAAVAPAKWVVKGLLEADALGLMYGAPGDGKSFVAFGIACSVATGTSWHGRKVKQGPVVYLAGEGQGGVARRLAAWEKSNGVPLADAPLYVSTRAVSLLTAESALQVVEEIEATLPENSPPPALVVIDTVARAFVGGDENSAQDMSTFVNIVDSLLKARWGAHVLLVHHSGKDASKGARGSSALKGALDQEFAVEKHINARRLVCTKMKDGEEPAPMGFKLHRVELARVLDQFGDEESIISAVVEMLEVAEAPVAKHKRGVVAEGLEEMSPANLVELIRREGWPGLSGLQDIFGCGRTQAVALVRKSEALSLIMPQGVGTRKSYIVTANAVCP